MGATDVVFEHSAAGSLGNSVPVFRSMMPPGVLRTHGSASQSAASVVMHWSSRAMLTTAARVRALATSTASLSCLPFLPRSNFCCKRYALE